MKTRYGFVGGLIAYRHPAAAGGPSKEITVLRNSCRLIVWIGLVVFVVASQAAADETEYFALFANGAKAGHMVISRNVRSDKVITTETSSITFNRFGTAVTQAATLEQTETPEGKPLAFKKVNSSSIVSQVVEGKIAPDGKVTLIGGGGAHVASQTAEWPRNALLSEGIRLLQKRYGLKEGLTYSYVQCHLPDLAPWSIAAHVIGRKQIDVLGKKEWVWEIQNDGGDISTLYVDDNFRNRKMLATMGDIQLEFVACTQAFALGKNTPLDVSNIVLESPVPLNNLAIAGSVIYHLSPKPQARLLIPNYDNQKVVADPSGLTVTVTAPKIPSGVAFPYNGQDPNALEALKPAPYLAGQGVATLARQAVGKTKDAGDAARRIEAFVRQYITTKDYSVGYATAEEVVKTRRGDCTEHAVLAAGMCRAVGIPAKVVSGTMYGTDPNNSRRRVFVPHAWFTVYLNGTWVPMDAASGYDLGHIAFSTGDGASGDYENGAMIMGLFRIDAATVQPQAPQPAIRHQRSY
jgi:hypothetical protein